MGHFEDCYLYGMPFEAREEVKEEARFDRYPPLYMRMRRHFRRRRWPLDYRW